MLKKLVTIAAALVALVASVVASVPSAAAADTVVLTGDFDDGTTQGWFARGPSAVAAGAEAARSGGFGLVSSGRSATWQGPGRDVRGILLPGATYRVEAYLRLAAGAGSAAIHATVQRTPDGGSQTFSRVGSVAASESDWALLSGSYSFVEPSSADLQLYFESDSETASFQVDDIVVTMTAPPPGGDPTETGIVSDFEDGARQGWNPRVGSETLTVTADDAHGGQRSLLTTGRTDAFTGPALSVLGRMGKGKRYTISVWMKLAPGQTPARLRLSIERRTQGTPTYETLVGDTTVTADAWVRFTNTYTLAVDVDFLAVYAESAGGAQSFYLDDFEMAWVRPLPIQTDIPSLKDVFAADFPIGTAIDRTETVGLDAELVGRHFASVTPGNALKWDATEPTEGQFSWTESDALVDFAVQKGIRVRGHTLVWHNQTPAWVFQATDGRPLTDSAEDKALLLRRLENHIRAVVGRYADRIYAWDVVNEVIDEYAPDGLRRSRWYEIAGLDYIRTAFRVAHEVAPDALLTFNDYNTELSRKRDHLYRVVRGLRAEGVPIEAVGHQLHINYVRPVAPIEAAIELFAGLGVRQEVTELDVSVYTNFTDSYAVVPAEVIAAQGYQYRDVFDILRRQRQHLASVTVWGASDANTWLKTFPFPRLDLPLLFDELLQAKPAYWGAVDPSRLPTITRRATAPAGSVDVDGSRDLQWRFQPDVAAYSRSGLAASFQARWSGSYLYVLVDVTDPTRTDRTDVVDILVDSDNGKTPAYEADDARHQVRRDGRHTAGIRAEVRRTSSGYRVEARVPIRGGAGVVGREIGFDVRVGDGAGGKVSWNDQNHGQDADTSRWGTLTLLSAVARVNPRRGTPVVDGVVDRVWSRAPTITTTVPVIGTPGATASARLLWDGGHLYVLARVTDPVLDESSPNAYEHDSVEIFVDPDNSKSVGYNDDDGQYRISFTNRQTLGGTFGAFAIADNLTSATAVVPGGYLVEARIELDTIDPRDGLVLGFELQVNDASGGVRASASTWHDPTGQAFVNTSRWGVAVLTS